MVNNINRKVQQYYGGNWGHPRKSIKKITEIPDPISPEIPKYKASKKYKKKEKKKYFCQFDYCPFCKEELLKRKQTGTFHVWPDRENFCVKCGAKEVDRSCPACKRDCWVDKEGNYKHMFCGCGFTGKKKESSK